MIPSSEIDAMTSIREYRVAGNGAGQATASSSVCALLSRVISSLATKTAMEPTLMSRGATSE